MKKYIKSENKYRQQKNRRRIGRNKWGRDKKLKSWIVRKLEKQNNNTSRQKLKIMINGKKNNEKNVTNKRNKTDLRHKKI